MAITITTGHQDQNGTYLPQDTNTWADLANPPFGTWANWTTWHPQPQDIELVITDDLGSVFLRQPQLILDSQGDLSITLKISDTGAFAGEETTIDLSDGTAKNYVQGRYYRYLITIAQDSDTPIPQAGVGWDTAYLIDTETQVLNDVDIPSASTDSSGFSLVDTTLGLITNVQATALQGDDYVADGYHVPLQNATVGNSRTSVSFTNNSVTTTDAIQKITTIDSLNFGNRDGQDRSIEFDSVSVFDWDTDDFTVDFWMRPTDVTIFNAVAWQEDDSGNERFSITISNGHLFVNIRTTDNTLHQLNTGTIVDPAAIVANTWYHVAVVRNGADLVLYLDGVAIETINIGAGLGIANSTRSFFIGGEDSDNDDAIDTVATYTDYAGYIQQFIVWDSAKYTTAFTPSTVEQYQETGVELLLTSVNGTILDNSNPTDYGDDFYFILQRGGVAVVESKNPLSIRVVNYQGEPWDGTVDLVLRGLPKIKQTSTGVDR